LKLEDIPISLNYIALESLKIFISVNPSVTSGFRDPQGFESPGDRGGATAVKGSERERNEPDHGIKKN